MLNRPSKYIGRLAPSPTGLLHLGHARTFWMAQARARAAGGRLLLRIDDLDRDRARSEFVVAMIEDLEWFGLAWDGPPYSQSARLPLYRAALQALREGGWIFPCSRSRRDVLAAAGAPHDDADPEEPVYPPSFRPPLGAPLPLLGETVSTNWRFRVPDGEVMNFTDDRLGPQSAVAGRHFGDFPIWRKDDTPSYHLACAVDDAAMDISEVVRGEDLLLSTFRQLLIFRALGIPAPAFHHCPLMRDASGARLAKRHDALALRTLRAEGRTPDEIRASWL